MRNSWSIIYLTKDYEAFRAYFLESVGALQGTGIWAWTWRHWECHWICHGQASLRKNWSFYDLTSWSLAEVLTVLTWRPLSQKKISLFLPGYKVHLQLLVPLFCSLMPNVKVLSFWSEIIKRLLGETHVFGRTFIFCNLLCNGGALDLLRHVVDLSVSFTMSQPAETT